MGIITYKKTDNKQLSKNFKLSEFVCHGKGCCTTVKVDERLVEYLQKIRDHFNASVKISSAYRCDKHNAEIGGTSGSKHRLGMAADIKVVGVEPAEVAKYAESIGILGIGLYETDSDGHFVHIDTRTKKSFWYGQKQARRTTFGGSADEYTLEEFVKDVQKAIGAKVDGVAGPETLTKTVTLSAHVNKKHPAVKYVQKRLLQLGYNEVGTVDGSAGPKFTSAIAHFQLDNNCTADGVITAGKTTWKNLLGMT